MEIARMNEEEKQIILKVVEEVLEKKAREGSVTRDLHLVGGLVTMNLQLLLRG